MQVCLSTNHLLWNTALGGHAWVFLNWALGLQAAGARVVLLERMRFADRPERLADHLRAFRSRTAELGLTVEVTLLENAEETAQLDPVRSGLEGLLVPIEQLFAEADLLLNFRYGLPQTVVDRFARSALVDIDPGLLQTWIDGGQVCPARHDLNFTIGETVGRPEARFPDCGMQWIHTPPPVHLPAWPVRGAPDDAPFTTVTNWWGEYELIAGQSVNNEKRSSFLACLDLPQRTRAPLELAVYQESEVGSELPLLRERGWRARPAGEVSSTAAEYRAYLQRSRGEFSCAKASCMVFANAWISDRTICYLASGKPAVVQDTGPSRMLPDACGLFRFADAAGAAAHLEALCDPEVYRRACHDARKLAEHHFDAARVLPRVLDAALAPRSGRDHATHG